MNIKGVGVFNVTFEPGCRNKPAKKLHPGDVVYIAPEVKHWHGATKNHWFTHDALEISAENSSNEWCEKVDDDQYFFS